MLSAIEKVVAQRIVALVSQIDRLMFGKLFGLNAKSAHAISLKSKV
jgi:hypothetical protein